MLYEVITYESGASDRLLMSGDHGQEDYDEVNAMKGLPRVLVVKTMSSITTEEAIVRFAGFRITSYNVCYTKLLRT